MGRKQQSSLKPPQRNVPNSILTRGQFLWKFSITELASCSSSLAIFSGIWTSFKVLIRGMMWSERMDSVRLPEHCWMRNTSILDHNTGILCQFKPAVAYTITTDMKIWISKAKKRRNKLNTLVPTWQHTRARCVRVDFRSNKREYTPRQVSLLNFFNRGRKDDSESIKTASFSCGYARREVRIRRLSNCEQDAKYAKLIPQHCWNVSCFRVDPNTFKMGFTYSGVTCQMVMVSSYLKKKIY